MPSSKILINDTVLKRKMAKFMTWMNKENIKDIKLYAGWFAQSAIKATRPGKGR